MTYRGDGGWSWPLARGLLEEIVSTHLQRIGAPGFYEVVPFLGFSLTTGGDAR